MYRSMEKHLDDFTMWILCLDELTFDVLVKLQLKKANLISLAEFESGDNALRTAKKNRTPQEYCWTVTPSLPIFVLKNAPNIEFITYLDADLLFFSNPYPVYEQFAGKSILIIEHRYSPQYAYLSELSGTYNVAMMVFRNDKNGLECLNWWRDRCNEWCYCRLEDGKFGDQKYLDDWPTRFKGVLVLNHNGANLAPWNIDNYILSEIDGKLMVDEDRLIFFHYHSTYQVYDKILEMPYGYNITKQHIGLIYRSYAKSQYDALMEIRRLYPQFCCGITKPNFLQMTQKLFSRKLCFVK